MLLLAMFLTFVFVTLFGYVVHWALHQPWMGRFNVSHMTHHLKLYPPEDYLSDDYRDAGKDSTTKFFAVIVTPILALVLALGFTGVITPLTTGVVLVEMLVLGWLHDYLHDAFHIKNHWLSKTPGASAFFDYWNNLHYNHHVDMQKNFGIFVFFWDRLFRTFWD